MGAGTRPGNGVPRPRRATPATRARGFRRSNEARPLVLMGAGLTSKLILEEMETKAKGTSGQVLILGSMTQGSIVGSHF